MKLKYEFVVSEMAGEFSAVAVDEGAAEFHGMIRLNREGYAVFAYLTHKGNATLEELLGWIGRVFDESDAPEIRGKVLVFLQWLAENGLLLADEGELG